MSEVPIVPHDILTDDVVQIQGEAIDADECDAEIPTRIRGACLGGGVVGEGIEATADVRTPGP